jgi:hypothetical protein
VKPYKYARRSDRWFRLQLQTGSTSDNSEPNWVLLFGSHRQLSDCVHRASLLAFENHGYIWDTHRLGIDPRIHVFENLPRKPTVRLLCSNIPPSILGHNISGKKSLVRNPTCIKRYKSPSLFQGVMSEADTMRSVVSALRQTLGANDEH